MNQDTNDQLLRSKSENRIQLHTSKRKIDENDSSLVNIVVYHDGPFVLALRRDSPKTRLSKAGKVRKIKVYLIRSLCKTGPSKVLY